MMQYDLNSAPDMPAIKERAAKGDYTVSEHVLRAMTHGHLTLADVLAAIDNGKIVEYRRNGAKTMASLVHGQAGDAAVAVLCAGGTDMRLDILLAWPVAARGWDETMGVTLEQGDNMAAEDRRCFFCGGEIKSVVVGNFDYRLEGQLYVVKNVPAGLCLLCGEKYISAEAANRIGAMLEDGAFSKTDAVRVIDYAMP